MKNKVVILQPSYLPWLGCFDQMAKADIFVFFDDVQYTRRDWRNRNYIKTRNGEKKFLTVPVESKGNYTEPINQMKIKSSSDWRKTHLALLHEHYGSAPYFEEIFELVKKNLERDWIFLADLTVELTQSIASYLGLSHVKFHRSSMVKLSPWTNPTEHLLRICEHFGASHYLSGQSAKEYLDIKQFEERGIKVDFQDYQHPSYPQLWGPFIPYLSVIDLLFNAGQKSLQILKNE